MIENQYIKKQKSSVINGWKLKNVKICKKIQFNWGYEPNIQIYSYFFNKNCIITYNNQFLVIDLNFTIQIFFTLLKSSKSRLTSCNYYYYYFFLSKTFNHFQKMQGEESYSHNQKPSVTSTLSGKVSYDVNHSFKESINVICNDQIPNISLIFCSLNDLFKMKEYERIEYGLDLLQELLKMGYSSKFIKYDESLRSIMNYFNKLANELEESPKSRNQLRMLKILSLISQILNQNPDFNFPFNKKFIKNIFLINSEFIEASGKKTSILRILSVIFLSLSKKTKLMKKFDLLLHLKSILLDNYFLIQDLMTFNRFTKAIKNIISILPISFAETKKYKIFQTMRRFMKKDQHEEVLKKLGMSKFERVTVESHQSEKKLQN